jgi:biopolymer transport protein ExbB/TolQ
MQFADRYFPWAVNLMSPVYWVYLLMAATALFNGLRGLSKFRLWRIDAAREKLEGEVRRLSSQVEPGSSRQLPGQDSLADSRANILLRLTELHQRCQREVGSFATPMGDEMFYRYQQSLIDRAIAALKS